MSPRIIHIPLSGGDRKAQAKGIRYAHGIHNSYFKESVLIRSAAEAKCARLIGWNARRGTRSCGPVVRRCPRPVNHKRSPRSRRPSTCSKPSATAASVSRWLHSKLEAALRAVQREAELQSTAASPYPRANLRPPRSRAAAIEQSKKLMTAATGNISGKTRGPCSYRSQAFPRVCRHAGGSGTEKTANRKTGSRRWRFGRRFSS